MKFTLLLAALFLLAAFFFPATEIDQAKKEHLRSLEKDAEEQSRLYIEKDDQYVELINHPYPLSGSHLFRIFLILDAILILLVSFFARKPATDAAPAKRLTFSRIELLYVVLLTAIALALRMIGADRDLWLDEVSTLFRYGRSSLWQIIVQAVSSNNHLLNSLLSRLSIQLFGESEFSLRLPAILFGAATVPVFYYLSRMYSSVKEAALATATLVFSYHHIFFSQNARGYSALLFGGLLGTIYLLKALASKRLVDWALYCLSMLICVFSLLWGFFILGAQFLCVTFYLLRKIRSDQEARHVARQFLIALGFIAYISIHIYSFMIPDILGFVFGEYRRSEVGWTVSAELLQVFLKGLALGPATSIALAGILGIILIGAFSLWRQDRLLTALLISPILLIFIVVILLGIGIFPRYFIFALPVAILLFCRGVLKLIQAIAGTRFATLLYCGAFVMMLVISGAMLIRFYSVPMQDFTGARKFIEKQNTNHAPVVAVGTAAECYRYYWPSIVKTHRVSYVDSLNRQHSGIWLIYSMPRDMRNRRPKLMDYIEREFSVVKRFPALIGDGDLYVCVSSQ